MTASIRASSSAAFSTGNSNPDPNSMTFVVQPVGGVSGLPLATQPVVAMLTPAGTLDVLYNGVVEFALNTGTGLLSGTVLVPVVAGLATAVNLVVTGSGSKTLIASAPNAVPIVSNSFTVL